MDAKQHADDTHASEPPDAIEPLGAVELAGLMRWSGASVPTIRKWWRGLDVSTVCRTALEAAAKKTNLHVPDRARRGPHTTKTNESHVNRRQSEAPKATEAS